MTSDGIRGRCGKRMERKFQPWNQWEQLFRGLTHEPLRYKYDKWLIFYRLVSPESGNGGTDVTSVDIDQWDGEETKGESKGKDSVQSRHCHWNWPNVNSQMWRHWTTWNHNYLQNSYSADLPLVLAASCQSSTCCWADLTPDFWLTFITTWYFGVIAMERDKQVDRIAKRDNILNTIKIFHF